MAMSQRERDQFIVAMTQHDVPLEVARKLLRYGTTLHRLAVAQCNGDWPADNGQRTVIPCPQCEQRWVPFMVKKGRCPDCRTGELVRATLADYPHVTPEFQGDPRGAVLRFTFADGRTTYAG